MVRPHLIATRTRDVPVNLASRGCMVCIYTEQSQELVVFCLQMLAT